MRCLIKLLSFNKAVNFLLQNVYKLHTSYLLNKHQNRLSKYKHRTGSALDVTALSIDLKKTTTTVFIPFDSEVPLLAKMHVCL